MDLRSVAPCLFALAAACGSTPPPTPPCDGDGESCPPGTTCERGVCVEVDAGPGCATDADCDDADFCNGAERCVEGACEAGTPPECDDGVACTDDGCSQERGTCVRSPDHALCADGELCTVVGCRRGMACTTAAECDDGVFCNGEERCDPEFGCQPGEAPRCDDGIACTVDACDRTADTCVSAPDDASCDDGDPCTDDRCSTADGCVAAPTDRDMDGFVGTACGGMDCDDGDASRRPSAPELCNRVDDDCDEMVDEDFTCARGASVTCATTCGSVGTGTCTAACERPSALDCAAPAEFCNGVDDDCDGMADEGFDCARGATEMGACGMCGARSRACGASCTWEAWGACAGEGACAEGSTVACTTTCGSTGSGACTASCAVPDAASCTPPAEVCNGVDDDCDGVADDGFDCVPAAVEIGSCGACGTRSRTCGGGCTWEAWGACAGEGACVAGSTVPCTTSCGSTGSGACTASCAVPDAASCTPPAEACNGVDDDCDGVADEGVVGDACPATDCAALHTRARLAPSGAYFIDPDGAGGRAPFEVYCDMTTDGGGWTYGAIVRTTTSSAMRTRLAGLTAFGAPGATPATSEYSVDLTGVTFNEIRIDNFTAPDAVVRATAAPVTWDATTSTSLGGYAAKRIPLAGSMDFRVGYYLNYCADSAVNIPVCFTSSSTPVGWVCDTDAGPVEGMVDSTGGEVCGGGFYYCQQVWRGASCISYASGEALYGFAVR